MLSVANPDIHLLRVFVTVAEAGGFSAAQIKLNVSQSTISTQMAALEARLGLRLCRRGRAGFALTDDGRRVYDAAQDLFAGCKDFSARVSALRGEITGELRIGMADALLSNTDFPFERIVKALRARLPQVSLTYRMLDPLAIERQLLDQKLDAGIHTFPNHVPGLRYVTLFSERQVLYCGRDHALFSVETFPSIEEISQFDYAARTYYGGMLRFGGMQPANISATSNHLEGILALILSGEYIGHLPDQIAKSWQAKGKLRPIMADALSYDSCFECVFRVGARISRAQKTLEEILVSAIA